LIKQKLEGDFKLCLKQLIFPLFIFICIVPYVPVARQRPRKKKTTVISMQQIRKYPTELKPLLGSGPRATVKVLLEAVVYVVRSEVISLDRPS
jgi:hypothetical protein